MQGAKLPPKPERRRPLRLWVRSARRLLVFGGFISPSRETSRHGMWSWVRDAAGLLAGAAVWVVTWFFPLTFMIAMAWGCHSHSRRLFRAALEHYAGESAPRVSTRELALALRRHTLHEFAHGAVLSLSITVPIAFLVYATYVRNHLGINAISSLGVLVAVSLVLAAGVYGSRR